MLARSETQDLGLAEAIRYLVWYLITKKVMSVDTETEIQFKIENAQSLKIKQL